MFYQVIGYVACAGVPQKLESEFAGERNELWLKTTFIVPFFRGGGVCVQAKSLGWTRNVIHFF